MQKILVTYVLGLLSMATVTWAQGSPAAGATDKAIVGLEEKWLQAEKTNNPALVDPLLASDFMGTSRDGKVQTKADILKDTKTTKWESAGYEAVKVKTFGSTAIATGIFKGKGT